MENLEKNLDFFPNVLYEAGQIFLQAQKFQQSPNKYLKKNTDVKNRPHPPQETQNLVFNKSSKSWKLVRKDNKDPPHGKIFLGRLLLIFPIEILA